MDASGVEASTEAGLDGTAVTDASAMDGDGELVASELGVAPAELQPVTRMPKESSTEGATLVVRRTVTRESFHASVDDHVPTGR